MTELTFEQKARCERVIEYLKESIALLNDTNEELYKLGSFPESPVGHIQWEFEYITIPYIKNWIAEGVEI